MARTETQLTTIAPQSRSAVGVSTFVQHYADPNAGQGLAQIAEALGVAHGVAQRKDEELQQQYENNLEYYAAQFARDRELGLVDATQVGAALPNASPIIAGRITELIGRRWANDYVRQRFDQFMENDALRLDPSARASFFNGLRDEISRQVEGRPFFGSGALGAVESVINEYESGWQRETARYHQDLQEDDFRSSVSAALLTQPSTEAAGEAASLLDFISGGESRGNYNAHYGNVANNEIDFTHMTINEVIQWQRDYVANGSPSSAVGRYQIILSTMRDLVDEMGLSGNELFTPDMQDTMARTLLERRGLSAWRNGELSTEDFANNLAQEWAALPMVSGPRAGQSYYQGDGLNHAQLTVPDFINALNSWGTAASSPVSAVDTVAGDTTSINPIRRRELTVSSAIGLALSARDTSILDRIPANMRGMPDIEARIAQAREQINDLQWQDYSRRNQIEEYNRQAETRQVRQEILDRIAAGERIDPAEYTRYGPEAYDYAVSVMNDEFTDPVVSARTAAQVRDAILQGSTIGGPSALFSDAPTYDEAIGIVETIPGLTASDRRQLIDELPTLLEGMNLINDPQISTFYSNRIGTDVEAYLQSVGGSINRLQGSNIAGTVRRTFDETVRSHVRASIEDGQGIPRGSRLLEIMERAEQVALQRLSGLQGLASGGPTTQQAPAQPQAPSLSEEESSLLNRYLDTPVEQPSGTSGGHRAQRTPEPLPWYRQVLPQDSDPTDEEVQRLRDYLEGN